jgi:CRISPR/Cas system-associated exonuclease Cas4 (RecB family)
VSSKPTKYKGAWSHSKLRDFESCRAQFKRRHIEKLPEPKSEALEWGSEVHNAIEAWLNNWTRKVHDGFLPMLSQLTALKKLKPMTETMWAHGKDWEPFVDPFDKQAWARAKLDAWHDNGLQVHVFDWKTGRPREASFDQVRFYAALALVRFPDAERVMTELWYVEHDKIVTGVVERKELLGIQKEFKRRATRIYNEAKWPEEPGMHCRWCPFRKGVGGPCSF